MEVDETQEEIIEIPVSDGPILPTGSLADRVSRRRTTLADQKTVTLDVPGLQGILAMEYRLLTYPTLRKIQQRHRHERDEAIRELYIAADTLVYASVNAVDIQPDGTPRPLPHAWGPELANLIGVEVPEDFTRRQALLAIIDVDTRVIGHYSEYIEWQQGLDLENDEEVVSDFGGTG